MASKNLENSRTCPVCNSVRFSKLRFCSNSSNPFWRKCKKCKSVYAREIPEVNILKQHYESYYDGINVEIPDFVKRTLENRVKSLDKYRTELNSVLDIGFGAGIFLEAASKQDWKCCGTEFSSSSIELAKKNGWNAHLGELSSHDLKGPFDLVSAIEVLEHVAFPKSIFMQASTRLRKGGAFFGTTPNGQSLNLRLLGEKWSVLSYPEHQVLLTPKSLRILTSRSNLRAVSVKTKGINPTDLIMNIKFARSADDIKVPSFNRVELGYSLNSFFERNTASKLVKKLVNYFLSFLRAGDSLEFLVEKD